MLESKEDIARFRRKIMEYISHSGACAVGICNAQFLEGGPPSADLTREISSAKSDFVFAVPLDDDVIEAYMGKIDHGKYQSHYITISIIAEGIASSACDLVCHPESEVRRKRVKLWTQGGICIQHEDGRLEAMQGKKRMPLFQLCQ